jgi:thiol-disulfide isomerase/thioredoxin
MNQFLFFSSSWCGSCKEVYRQWEAIKSATPLPIRECKLDEDFELASKYTLKSIPTMIEVDSEGNEVRRMSGANAIIKEFIG